MPIGMANVICLITKWLMLDFWLGDSPKGFQFSSHANSHHSVSRIWIIWIDVEIIDLPYHCKLQNVPEAVCMCFSDLIRTIN